MATLLLFSAMIPQEGNFFNSEVRGIAENNPFWQIIFFKKSLWIFRHAGPPYTSSPVLTEVTWKSMGYFSA
jgi:hypothetical protein